MKSFLPLLVFFCLLPLLVVAHDCWYAANQKDPEDFLYHFRFSDVGWLWLAYHRPSFEAFQAGMNPDTWTMWIEPLLRMRAVIVAAVPLAILIAIEFMVKGGSSLGIRMPRRKGKEESFSLSEKKSGPMKYKRK